MRIITVNCLKDQIPSPTKLNPEIEVEKKIHE